MPGLRKRNSNRPSPTPHIKHRLTRLERQQPHKIASIRGSLQRPKMPSPFVPLKRVISPPPTSLQAHPFLVPICGKQLRTSTLINHGPSPSQQKKRLLPKEEPQPAYIRKRTVPTPNRHTNQVVQERSNCNRDRTQPRSRCAGAPLPGGRHIRSPARTVLARTESTLSALRLVRNSRSTKY